MDDLPSTTSSDRPVGLTCVEDQLLLAYADPSGFEVYYTVFDGTTWRPQVLAGPQNGDGPPGCTRTVFDDRRPAFITGSGVSITGLRDRAHLAATWNSAGRPSEFLYASCGWPCLGSTHWSRLVSQGGNIYQPYRDTRLGVLDSVLYLFFRPCVESYGELPACGPLQFRYKEGD